MRKPTLLFVEEIRNSLSEKVISREDIRLVLLRFKQNMFFDESYLKKTSPIPCFILNKETELKNEVKRFETFCYENNLNINYFYNDSEYNQELVQEFASLLCLNGALNKEQALCARDKAVMKKRLQKINYKTMAYGEISSIEDVIDFTEKIGGFPVIVKWRKGLSSKEVYKVSNIDELRGFGLDLSKNRFIVEQYCSDLIWCIDSLIQNGKVVATFYAWLPYTNLSFAENKEKFAQITVNEKPDWFKFDGSEITQNITNEVGYKNGYMHLETFVNFSGEPTICEFAWRTPGEHMLLNHSIVFNLDVYSILIDIMIGKSVTLNLISKKCVGDMFLPIKNGVISSITPYEKLKNFPGVINGEIAFKDGDVLESKRQYTSSAGWIQIEGKSKEEVLERMIEVYKNFKINFKFDKITL